MWGRNRINHSSTAIPPSWCRTPTCLRCKFPNQQSGELIRRYVVLGSAAANAGTKRMHVGLTSQKEFQNCSLLERQHQDTRFFRIPYETGAQQRTVSNNSIAQTH